MYEKLCDAALHAIESGYVVEYRGQFSFLILCKEERDTGLFPLALWYLSHGCVAAFSPSGLFVTVI